MKKKVLFWVTNKSTNRGHYLRWSSESRQGLSLLQGKAVPSFLSYFKILSNDSALGIEPATSRSAVKCSADWANPAAAKKKRKRQKTNKHKQTKKEWFGDPQRLILNLHSFIRGRASLDNNTCVTHLICANLYHDAIFDFNNQKVSKSTGTGFLRNAHGQSIATRPTLTVTHKKWPFLCLL